MDAIMDELEERFTLLFHKLNVRILIQKTANTSTFNDTGYSVFAQTTDSPKKDIISLLIVISYDQFLTGNFSTAFRKTGSTLV